MKLNIALILVSMIILAGGCSSSSDGSSSAIIPSATGELDTTFNGSGIVVDNNASGLAGGDIGNAVTTDSNGRVLVAGSSPNLNGTEDMVIWCYEDNGSLDTNFGSSGYVFHDNAAGGNSDDAGNAMIIDLNGKILVAGESVNSSGNFDMTIWRYNSDGTLDTTFNGTGYITHDNAAGGSGNDHAESITLDSSNKIIVTGSSRNGGGHSDMALWRYDSNGSLDPTFGTSGTVTHDSAAGGSGNDYGYSVIVDDSGKLLVTGYSDNGSDWDMVIWRYNSNGTLDTTFSGTGVVIVHNAGGGSGNDYGRSIVLDNNGKILVTGCSTTAGGDVDMLIWRYDDNGTLDPSFGTSGTVMHDNAAGGSFHDYGVSMTIDTNNKILVTGHSTNATPNSDMAIWRYDDTGTLDTTLNSSGFITHDSAAGGSSYDYGLSIAVDSSGKILVTGRSRNADGNYDMVVWRYR